MRVYLSTAHKSTKFSIIQEGFASECYQRGEEEKSSLYDVIKKFLKGKFFLV
jgi:hypothetical protein